MTNEEAAVKCARLGEKIMDEINKSGISLLESIAILESAKFYMLYHSNTQCSTTASPSQS